MLLTILVCALDIFKSLKSVSSNSEGSLMKREAECGILNPIMLSKAYLVPLSKGQLCTFSLSSTCGERLNNVQEMRSNISKLSLALFFLDQCKIWQTITERNFLIVSERERQRERAHTLWFLVDLFEHAPIPVLRLVYALVKELGKRKIHCSK